MENKKTSKQFAINVLVGIGSISLGVCLYIMARKMGTKILPVFNVYDMIELIKSKTGLDENTISKVLDAETYYWDSIICIKRK